MVGMVLDESDKGDPKNDEGDPKLSRLLVGERGARIESVGDPPALPQMCLRGDARDREQSCQTAVSRIGSRMRDSPCPIPGPIFADTTLSRAEYH